MYDVVYILKDHPPTEELRYSIRSVCENFPYNKIWFVCGIPDGIVPDGQIRMAQRGASDWQKSSSSVYEVCRNKNVTDNFWLFNDDFFVMKKIKSLKPVYDGTLYRRIQDHQQWFKGKTLYSIELERARNLLMEDDYTTFNYAVHVPMLINKEKALEIFRMYPDVRMFRSMYGNVHNIGGINRKDVKIVSCKEEPIDPTFLSTTETSFKDGKVGEYIRNRFPDKCKYEV